MAVRGHVLQPSGSSHDQHSQLTHSAVDALDHQLRRRAHDHRQCRPDRRDHRGRVRGRRGVRAQGGPARADADDPVRHRASGQLLHRPQGRSAGPQPRRRRDHPPRSPRRRRDAGVGQREHRQTPSGTPRPQERLHPSGHADRGRRAPDRRAVRDDPSRWRDPDRAWPGCCTRSSTGSWHRRPRNWLD